MGCLSERVLVRRTIGIWLGRQAVNWELRGGGRGSRGCKTTQWRFLLTTTRANDSGRTRHVCPLLDGGRGKRGINSKENHDYTPTGVMYSSPEEAPSGVPVPLGSMAGSDASRSRQPKQAKVYAV